VYLTEAHGQRFEFEPAMRYFTIARHGAKEIVQKWELNRWTQQGFRCIDVQQLPDARKILVIRNMGLGDVLMVTPILRALIKAGKHVEFATLGRYVPLLYGFDGLAACHALGTDYLPHRFDACVDLNWLPETSKLAPSCPRQAILAKAAGVRIESTVPEYKVSEQERDWASKIVTGQSAIGIQMRASCPLRTYPLPHTRQVVRQLAQQACTVFLLGDRREEDLPGAINLTGKLSIRQTAALLEQCHCLIAPDSGLLHLAAAVHTPSVGLFGPVAPELRVSGYPLCTAITGNEIIGCKACNDGARCCKDRHKQSPHGQCLEAIAPQKVAQLAIKKTQEACINDLA